MANKKGCKKRKMSDKEKKEEETEFVIEAEVLERLWRYRR